MLTPLYQFYCDTCYQVIDRPLDGVVEWIHAAGMQFDFRMVHGWRAVRRLQGKATPRNGCFQHPHTAGAHSMSIPKFLTQYHLEWVAEVALSPAFSLEGYQLPLRDPDQFLEVVRRLLVPYYEEGRLVLEQALAEGAWRQLDGYRAEVLQSLIVRYRNVPRVEVA